MQSHTCLHRSIYLSFSWRRTLIPKPRFFSIHQRVSGDRWRRDPRAGHASNPKSGISVSWARKQCVGTRCLSFVEHLHVGRLALGYQISPISWPVGVDIRLPLRPMLIGSYEAWRCHGNAWQRSHRHPLSRSHTLNTYYNGYLPHSLAIIRSHPCLRP